MIDLGYGSDCLMQQDIVDEQCGDWTPFTTESATGRSANDSASPPDEGLIGSCSEPCPVPVRSLLPADSPRLQGENIEHMQLLARIDASLPPIIVHRPTMRVIDGMHRLGAARLRGDQFIQVRFFEGTVQEAFVLGVQANIAHGLPLSLEDRTRAAEQVIRSYPGLSDRAIAAVVGLGARTVGNIRRRLPARRDTDPALTRTGRDGRVRPLDHTQGRRRVIELMNERPGASMREIARSAGVSPSTVRDVRQRLERGDDPLRASRRRHGEEPPALEAAPGIPDTSVMLRGLQTDPALRFTESGRLVLRWISARTIGTEERLDAASRVPAPCTYLVADVARAYADEWLQFADELERRGVQ
jgi:hypothetical protein